MGPALIAGGASLLGGVLSPLVAYGLQDDPPEPPPLPRGSLRQMEPLRSQQRFQPVAMPGVGGGAVELPRPSELAQGGIFAGFQPDPAPVYQPPASGGYASLLRAFG